MYIKLIGLLLITLVIAYLFLKHETKRENNLTEEERLQEWEEYLNSPM